MFYFFHWIFMKRKEWRDVGQDKSRFFLNFIAIRQKLQFFDYDLKIALIEIKDKSAICWLLKAEFPIEFYMNIYFLANLSWANKFVNLFCSKNYDCLKLFMLKWGFFALCSPLNRNKIGNLPNLPREYFNATTFHPRTSSEEIGKING